MTVDVAEKTDYSKSFETFKKNQASKDSAWLNKVRQSAFVFFQEHAFPTTDHEEWKYTSVDPIVNQSFRFVFSSCEKKISLAKLELGHPDWYRLVFVNGIYSEELSSVSNLSEGVRVESLHSALKTDSSAIEPYLAKYARPNNDAFTALNTAFIFDGAFIFTPKGKKLEKPIHLLFVSHDINGPFIAQPRNLIVAGENSEATVVESYVALEDHVYFTNAVTEIILGQGSKIGYYKDQKESIHAFHIGTTQIYQARDSKFYSTSVALGAGLSRHNLHLDLDAEGVESDLKGIYFVTGQQHVDNHLVIDHKKPHGSSRHLYKGILDGKSTGAFSGKIFIRPDAQQTDAWLLNKNLLLSEGAKIDTKPQFEIFADDVKATHGAAIGQLAEDEIFYLKSRGLSDQNARALLTFGFASELVEKIKLDPIRWELDRIIWTRLQERPEKR